MPTVREPRNRNSASAFLARLLVLMQASQRAEDDISRRYKSCRWCDSTERQLNNEIMFARSARF